MSNWVDGYIIPYGTKTQVKNFVEYLTSQEKWKNIINRNGKHNPENMANIYCNSAAKAIEIAEEMEEQFKGVTFRFFICDDINDIGWGINYMSRIESRIFYQAQRDDDDNFWFEPQDVNTVIMTDERFEQRKALKTEEEKKRLTDP